MQRSHGRWLAAVVIVASSLSRVEASSLAAADLAAARVLASADHRQQPFAVVDKQAATISVYRADGALAGTTAALLGRTLGDHSMPGVGERAQTGQLRAGDRTTPAGRFDSEPGHNRNGDAIVWLDYTSAFAIHRLRAGPSKDQRSRRLRSPSAADKRVSDGCVVVPEAFFDAVVQPTLGRVRGVVYVLPEFTAQPALRQAN